MINGTGLFSLSPCCTSLSQTVHRSVKEVSAQTPRILMLERRMCGAKSKTAGRTLFCLQKKRGKIVGIDVPDEYYRCGRLRYPPGSDTFLHPICYLKISVDHPNLCDRFCSRDDTDPAHLYFCFPPFTLRSFWASIRILSWCRKKLVKVPDWISITFRD